MKHQINKFAVLILVFIFCGNSWAQSKSARRLANNDGPETEIHSNTTASGYKKNFSTGFSSAGYRSQKENSQLDLVLSMGYLMNRNVEIGGEGGLLINSNSGSTLTAITAFVFGVYNIDPRYTESFYIKGGFGLRNISGGGSASVSRTGFFMGAGKRFFLWPHLCYSPEFRISQMEKEENILSMNLLNFSIFF